MVSVWMGCQSSSNKNRENKESDSLSDSIHSEDQDSFPHTAHIFKRNFACYYLIGDKYSEETDSMTIHTWWTTQLKQFEQNGFTRNLFDRQGPGANGSEWNSSTDLFLAAYFEQDLSTQSLRLLFNEQPVPNIQFKKYQLNSDKGCLVYAQVPKKTWISRLKNINESVFREMFGQEHADSLIKLGHSEYLKLGQAVKIKLVLDDNGQESISYTDFLYVMFGE